VTVYLPLFGDIGATALLLLYAWLLSAIMCSKLSEWKGYGEKPGLGTGLILSVIGVIIWLLWPSRSGSRWRGFFGRGRASTQG
jgi:hypothetical protein